MAVVRKVPIVWQEWGLEVGALQLEPQEMQVEWLVAQ